MAMSARVVVSRPGPAVLRGNVEPVEAHVAGHLREPGRIVGLKLAGVGVEVGLEGDDLALDETLNGLDDQRLLVAHGEVHVVPPCSGAVSAPDARRLAAFGPCQPDVQAS